MVLLRYVQSSEQRKKILHACHVDKTAGHMGRTRTLYRIKERFMWHGMVKDVQEMVCIYQSLLLFEITMMSPPCLQLSKCDVCQQMNKKLTTGTPQLNPIPIKAPWHMLGIDFIGPVSPVAEDGSRFVFTMTDYFTKWAEAIPTPDKSASSVATGLFKVLLLMLCTLFALGLHIYCRHC